MSFKLSKNSLNNISGVDPDLIRVARRAIEITLVDFGYPKLGGKRTALEQRQLFEDGKSRADGYMHKSRHQSGLAIDFYAYVDGSASWKHEHLAMVAAAHLQAASELGVKVKWGGLWKSNSGGIYGWDMPHIEKVV